MSRSPSLHVRDVPGEIIPVFQEPAQAPAEAGKAFDDVPLEDLAGIERDQAHHRADFQRDVPAAELEPVVVEAVLLVPQSGPAEGVYRVGDPHEVLEELRGEILVDGILLCQLEGHRQHRRAVEGHPCRPVGLLQASSGRQGPGAVEDADVVETEETAGEDVLPLGVLAVHPPGEVEEKLLEDSRKKQAVPLAACPGHLVDPPRRPGVHGRIDVAERELVGGDLAVGVHVPLAEE